MYSIDVRECSDVEPDDNTITLDGFSRRANISGLEEDSNVTIHLIASNAGGSAPIMFPANNTAGNKNYVPC